MVDKNHRADSRPLTLTPQLLVAAYCQGMFPMARSRGSERIDWYSPDPRAILPLDGFRCPRSLRQRVRRGDSDVRMDTAFERVIRACARPRPTQHDTWINPQIVEAYTRLHELGLAHSVEAWREDRLVGGLYGVAIGGAFFGESMFCRPDLGGTDASKVCLVHLVEHLRRREFMLLDVQMRNDHMAQFGIVEIRRDQYMRMLERAISVKSRW